MNKKGFTLVEVLAILAILGVMVTIIFPNLGGSVESKKEKELDKIINIVENAGKAYFSFNSNVYKVNLNTLVDEKYIVPNTTNPSTGEVLKGCVRKTLTSDDLFTYTYGNCNPIEVPLIVDLNGGETTQHFESTYNDATEIELDMPTHQTSNFKGWKIVKGNSILNGNTLIIGTTETIIYAVWEDFATLIVDLDGGETTQEFKSMYASGTNITLEEPTKKGYTFTGWTASGGNLSGNTFTMGDTDTILTATWTPITYYVKYNANGGSGTMINSMHTYNIPKELTSNSFIRNGYVFNGWNTKADGSGVSYEDNAIVQELSSVNEDIVNLYAQWDSFMSLYNLGNQNTDITGGWRTFTFSGYGSTAPTINEKINLATGVVNKNTISAAGTVNKINLIGKTKLYANVTYLSPPNQCVIGISSSTTISSSNSNGKIISSTGEIQFELPVSEGEYYIYVYASNGKIAGTNVRCEFDKIWLE